MDYPETQKSGDYYNSTDRTVLQKMYNYIINYMGRCANSVIYKYI